jgi:hypothetical protein
MQKLDMRKTLPLVATSNWFRDGGTADPRRVCKSSSLHSLFRYVTVAYMQTGTTPAPLQRHPDITARRDVGAGHDCRW